MLHSNKWTSEHICLSDLSLCWCVLYSLCCHPTFCFVFHCCSNREVGQQKPVLMSVPSWRSVPKSKSTNAILQELPSPGWSGAAAKGAHLFTQSYMQPVCLNLFCLLHTTASGRSELDELQEEVARKARQQEQQKRKEAEREAAMGFNPKPSKFMDLDQLQHQGMGQITQIFKKRRKSLRSLPWVCVCVYVFFYLIWTNDSFPSDLKRTDRHVGTFNSLTTEL